jgi:dTDP-4-amino-4,6-dideoxygalactose transaminase
MAELAICGGAPVRPQGYPKWPVHDEREVQAVAAAVRSGRWGGFPEPGPLAAEFAARFATYQGAAHGVAMANGTVTMEVALEALGIGWGDEVIVPALTFSATPYAAMAAGALPVFCDVDPGTLTIDPDQVEAAVTPRTRAVMPVHLGHQMADMDRIMEVARRHSLAVVEDCAHAHGQRWRGRGAGSIGEFGSFSHQSYKLLTAGEGGSLLSGDERLARRAHSLIDCGRPKDAEEKEYTFGANYRLSELQAALLLVALERFGGQQAERAALAARFQELAAGIPGVRLLPPDERITRWSFYRYVLLVEPEAFAGATNDLVCDALEAEGVGAWVGYPPMSRYDLFQPSLSRLPVAVEHAERLDPASMSFPVAERLALRQTVYLDENVFRAGPQGVEDAVEALAKVQRHAAELSAGHAAQPWTGPAAHAVAPGRDAQPALVSDQAGKNRGR